MTVLILGDHAERVACWTQWLADEWTIRHLSLALWRSSAGRWPTHRAAVMDLVDLPDVDVLACCGTVLDASRKPILLVLSTQQLERLGSSLTSFATVDEASLDANVLRLATGLMAGRRGAGAGASRYGQEALRFLTDRLSARSQQLMGISELSSAAVLNDAEESVWNQALTVAVEGLGLPHAALLRYRAEEHSLEFVQGIGFDWMKAGAQLPIESWQLEAQVLVRGRMVAVRHRHGAPRDPFSSPLLNPLVDVRCAAILLPGEDRPLGTLLVAVEASRSFDTGDLLFLQAVANAVTISQSRLAHEHDLRDSNLRLEQAVEQRTAELTLTNERLSEEMQRKAAAEAEIRKSEGYFRSLLENASDMVSVLDEHVRLKYHSPAAERALGYLLSEVRGMDALALVHRDEQADAREKFNALLANPRSKAWMTYRHRCKDGQWRWFEALAENLLDDPNVQGVVINSRDVTDQHEAERVLRALVEGTAQTVGREFFRQLVKSLGQALGTRIAFVTERLEGSAARGRLLAGWHDGRFVETREYALGSIHLEQLYQHGQVVFGEQDQAGDLVEGWAAGQNLRSYVAMPLITSSGRVVGHLGILDERPMKEDPRRTAVLRVFATRAAAELERLTAEAKLFRNAYYDGLTGLPNRALFFQRLDKAMARHRKQDSDRYAVLFLDLDRFKVVNDSLGHQRGDQLLVAAANRISSCVGSSDTVAHLSGDEFAVLLDGIDGVERAAPVAARLVERFQQSFQVDGVEIYSTVSVGLACGNARYRQPVELLRDADNAMYRAKALGRARYVVFDEAMHAQVLEQFRIESELERAIRQGEFELHYQPIIDLQTRRLIGAEALIRWRHPERGLLLPGAFLQVAEENGRIAALDRISFDASCAQLRELRQIPGGADLFLSVNVSARQIGMAEFLPQIESSLARHGVDGRQLVVEITESALMVEDRQVMSSLVRLRELGMRLAIDDFGMGYSSLGRLNRLPIDTLKIDRQFVCELDEGNDGVVRAVIGLAHSLGLQVVGEGIETETQALSLLGLQCNSGQGYLFGRPMPPDEFQQRVRRDFAEQAAA